MIEHPSSSLRQRLARLPLGWVLLFCVTLGLAPFAPVPHLWEKLTLLAAGELRLPIDWFDLFFHAAPWLLLGCILSARALGRWHSNRGVSE